MIFLTWLLKVNIAVILLYGFYRLFFQQDTFFRWKRAALIGISFLAILYPFVDISRQFINNYHLQEAIQNGILPIYILPEITVTGQASGQSVSYVHYLPQLLFGLYCIMAAIFLVRILFQTGAIIRIVRRSQTMELHGHAIYSNADIQTPFSFFRWIVLNPERYTPTELQEILRHEETHSRQAHSIDILLAELLCVLCWFNPFAWLLKREIRMNLEFLADQSVLASGYEAEHYQFHLLRLTYHKAAAKLSNNFNVSPLKKRIFMMNKKQSSKLSIIKYALFIPVAGALVFFNATLATQAGTVKIEAIEIVMTPETSAPAEMLVQDTVVLSDIKGKVKKVVPPPPDLIFNHVEEMPRFPGDEQALMQWLKENIKYPPSAVESAINGRVIVRFVVTSDGSVECATVVKSLEPACDAEAIRAVLSMPKWKPGKQNGKAVSVYYTLPINFQLTNDTENAPKNDDIQVTTSKSEPVPLDDVIVEVDGKAIPRSGLGAIDPNTIESISVIKDQKPNKIVITLKKQ
jgi:TonB family protein